MARAFQPVIRATRLVLLWTRFLYVMVLISRIVHLAK